MIRAGQLASFLAGTAAAGTAHADLATVASGSAAASERIDWPLSGDERCLAMALYYESGNEPRAGKEAVAQVVLNRLAHPTYPKSICTIVWQGAQRRTGCQFTFTCDGSLARRPAGPAWEESLTIARSAILTSPRPDLMGALNYHADYVRPSWASKLRLMAQIGRHIFYGEPAGMSPARGASPDAPGSGIAGAAATSASRESDSSEPAVWGISLAAAARR